LEWVDVIMPEVKLTEADLTQSRWVQVVAVRASGARLKAHGVGLDHCDLKSAKLPEAILSHAECTGVDFRHAELSRTQAQQSEFVRCDFRGANLHYLDGERAQFHGCRFAGANLKHANLLGANLLNARELTAEQLLSARIDDRTILPNGSRGPYRRHSGAERPKSLC